LRNSISSPSDVFSLDIVEGKITIKTDPKLAQDLIYALSVLLDLSRAIRSKVIHARAYAAASNKQDIKRRQLEFRKKSSEIFARFQEHLNNGCAGDKAAALQCIKKDFKLGYGVAQIYVIEGRRLDKAIGRKARAAPHALRAKAKAHLENKTASPYSHELTEKPSGFETPDCFQKQPVSRLSYRP
jgi:hypothetical protein